MYIDAEKTEWYNHIINYIEFLMNQQEDSYGKNALYNIKTEIEKLRDEEKID